MIKLTDYFLGSTAFTAGCVFFTVDAFRTKNRVLIAGCLLFDVGCAFFISDSLKSQS